MSNEYFFYLYPIPERGNFGAIMVYLTRAEFNTDSDIQELRYRDPGNEMSRQGSVVSEAGEAVGGVLPRQYSLGPARAQRPASVSVYRGVTKVALLTVK